MLRILLKCLLFLNFLNIYNFQNITQRIEFDNADLATTANYATGPVHLEAFKSSDNDKILKEDNQTKYMDLNWYSLGSPKFYKTLCVAANKTFLFHFSGRGFHTFSDSLKQSHRRILAQHASSKYSIPISPNQIKPIPISKVECVIYFNESETNRTMMIRGTGTNLDSGMPRLNFQAPSDTYERIAFENRNNNSQPLNVECHMWSGEINEKSTPLVITPAQLKKLDLAKKVHGKLQTVFMTRQQLLKLAGEIYRHLKIMSEYKVPEFEFSEEFLKLTLKEQGFLLMPLDKAINSLSKYSLNPKLSLKLNSLKKDASALLKVEKVGNFSLIKPAKSNRNLEPLFGSKSARIAKDAEQDWIEANRTLDAQLYDLNYWVRDEIEWEMKEGKLFPKSIALAKLNKTSLIGPLKFSTVKKVTIKANYTKIIKMDANF